MVAAVIAALGGVGDRVAHGGPIVAVLGGIDHIVWFFIAVIVGSIVTTLTVLLLKRKTPAINVDETQAKTTLATEVTTPPQSSVNENLDNKNTAEQQVFHQELIERVQTPMTRDEAIDCLIQQLDKHGYINDCLTLKDAIVAREAEATTAIGMNVAIPHAKSAAVKEPVVAVLQHQTGVKWDSLDGSLPQIIFLIAVPNHSNDTHLKLLQRLSRALMDDATRKQFIEAASTADIYHMLQQL